MITLKFSEKLNSLEEQAAEAECSADWVEHCYLAFKGYFIECERDGKRATIKGLQSAILERAKDDDFGFN